MIQERRRAASEEGFCICPACGERAEYQRGAPVGRRGVLDVLRNAAWVLLPAWTAREETGQ